MLVQGPSFRLLCTSLFSAIPLARLIGPHSVAVSVNDSFSHGAGFTSFLSMWGPLPGPQDPKGLLFGPQGVAYTNHAAFFQAVSICASVPVRRPAPPPAVGLGSWTRLEEGTPVKTIQPGLRTHPPREVK